MDSVLNATSYAVDLTFVQSIISQDTTWTLSGSPYVITGNVTVSNGTTLTIEPGVEIEFDGDFSLLINGSLYAVGTNDKWITFTSNNLTPHPGDWNTIKFAAAENESFILENCIVEYAKNGITIQNSGKAIIKNSSITDNFSSGIHVIGESNLIIEGNTIRLNNNGISSTGKVSSGIKVLNNIIDSNYNGIHLYASSVGICQIKNITISGNTFSLICSGGSAGFSKPGGFRLSTCHWSGRVNSHSLFSYHSLEGIDIFCIVFSFVILSYWVVADWVPIIYLFQDRSFGGRTYVFDITTHESRWNRASDRFESFQAIINLLIREFDIYFPFGDIYLYDVVIPKCGYRASNICLW